MKKLGAFVIPYFGRFNNYFPLFLASCAKNPEFDWLLFTDDARPFPYPDNVKVFPTTFEAMRERFQAKFDTPISLVRPYKFCDYKPVYGYVFEEELSGYPDWGYCDCDLIFGKLSHFITEADVEQYDKIGMFGHMTLFRNDAAVNRLFLQKLKGRDRWQEVSSEYWNHSFDEEWKDSINNIFEAAGKRMRTEEYQANIYTKSSGFRITYMQENRRSYDVEKRQNNLFVWENGELYRYRLEGGKLIREEYCYIHLQSRPMQVHVDLEHIPAKFKIIPNAFDPLEADSVTAENIATIREKYPNLHYFRLRSKNLFIKIRKRLTGSKI